MCSGCEKTSVVVASHCMVDQEFLFFLFFQDVCQKHASKLLLNHMLDVSGNLSSPTLDNMRTSKASVAKHDTDA